MTPPQANAKAAATSSRGGVDRGGVFESEEELLHYAVEAVRHSDPPPPGSTGGRIDHNFEVRPEGLNDLPRNLAGAIKKKKIDWVMVRPGGILSAIEAKLAASLDVFHQAQQWRKFVHYSSALVPAYVLTPELRESFAKLCLQSGIGLITCAKLPHCGGRLKVIFEPALNKEPRGEGRYITDALGNAHKTLNRGGTPGSVKSYTKAQDRFDRVREWAKANSGGTFKEMKIDLKLSKAEATEILRLADRDEIAGVKFQGSPSHVFAVNPPEP